MSTELDEVVASAGGDERLPEARRFAGLRQGSPEGLRIEDVLLAARRRIWVILGAAIVVCGAALLASLQMEKQYTAVTSLVFNNNQTGQQIAGLQATSNNAQQATQDTNVELVRLGEMARRTAQRIGQGWTEAKVRDAIEVRPVGATNVVEVRATASNAALAAHVANVYSQLFVDAQDRTDRRYYRAALELVQRELSDLPKDQLQSDAGLSLQARAQSLRVLAQLRSITVRVAEHAQPPSGPSSPKVLRNAAIGLLLGLILGAAVAFILERLDRRIKTPDEVAAGYDLPLLGIVPELKAAEFDVAGPGPAPEVAEAFQLIRAHLRYFNVGGDPRLWMIVSASPGEGKTTVAFNVAKAAASSGSQVLLIEADLRRPTLASRIGIPDGWGLADVLVGSTGLADAVHTIPAGADHTLDVLAAGKTAPPNPSELLESAPARDLMTEVKDTYDFVVVDTPPLSVVSDAFPLVNDADGVIVVARIGLTSKDEVRRLRSVLTHAGAPVRGVVANGVPESGLPSYGYGTY